MGTPPHRRGLRWFGPIRRGFPVLRQTCAIVLERSAGTLPKLVPCCQRPSTSKLTWWGWGCQDTMVKNGLLSSKNTFQPFINAVAMIYNEQFYCILRYKIKTVQILFEYLYRKLNAFFSKFFICSTLDN